MPVIQLDLELGIGQRIDDGTVHLDGVVLGHGKIVPVPRSAFRAPDGAPSHAWPTLT
jgi:hypothetical protein